MATEASLAGVQRYGIGWRYQLNIKQHIPIAPDLLTKEQASTIATKLRVFANSLDLFGMLEEDEPEEAEEAKDFALDFDEYPSDGWDLDIQLEVLNNLYDWAGYRRILIN